MRVSHFVTRHTRSILFVAILLLVPSFYGILHTKIDYNVLNYLPKTLDSMRGEGILDKEFGDASSAMLIIENKSIREIIDLKKKIASIDNVVDVTGVDDIIDPSIPREVLPASIRDTFYSEKGTVILIRFEDESAAPSTEAAVKEIRGLLDKDCFLSGSTPANLDSRALSDRESPIYLGLAVILVILILGLTMESWIIPLIFLMEMGFAIIFNLGSNLAFGKISFLTQSLAAVLQLGTTMDFSIFLLHRYEEERLLSDDKREAMAKAIEKTFPNILGSALTTIAGFLALCVMVLALGADIGIVMAKGVLIGLIATVTILPSMILFLDKPIHKLSHKPLMFSFKGLSAFSSKYPIVFSILFVLLFIPAIYGKK